MSNVVNIVSHPRQTFAFMTDQRQSDHCIILYGTSILAALFILRDAVLLSRLDCGLMKVSAFSAER